jgi:hypothetical protein
VARAIPSPPINLSLVSPEPRPFFLFSSFFLSLFFFFFFFFFSFDDSDCRLILCNYSVLAYVAVWDWCATCWSFTP